MSLLTNKGKEAISTAISSSSQFSLVRIGFGDKQGSIDRKFVESDTSLVNEKFRINLDSVYYLPTVDNNTILKITANLTPEQSATMEAVTVREFGIYDNFNNLLIVGDTVPTITKDSNNNNGIDFEINLTLPTSEKVARVLVTSKEGEFSNAERIKLNSIEEGATKNKTDSFLLDRKNHTGKIDIENVDGLVTILYSLETVEDNDDKLSGKVDKVTGKGLSTNDYTDTEKDKLNSIDVESLAKVVNDVTKLKSDFNTLVIKEELYITLEDYVIKVPGKELSSNDYTYMEKNKLASIDINKIDNDIFDLEKRPYFMGRFQDEDEMLSLFFYDGNEEDDKKPIYNDMYYYNIGLNSVMYYNGGTWIKGNNLNIVDDLNSTVPGSVLDANQGRILKGLIDNITTILNSDETSLDTIQEIVDFIKINRDTLNALTISSIAGLQNALNNKLDKNQNAVSATKLATARNLTIGSTAKSFDGGANVSWTRVEMGVPQTTTSGNVGTENDESCIAYVSNPLLGAPDGALYSHVYSATWKHQIQGDYRTGQIAVRGKNNGTWQAWRTVLDSSNFNNYSPTKTGAGASGTWGINITGNAETATNASTLNGYSGARYLLQDGWDNSPGKDANLQEDMRVDFTYQNNALFTGPLMNVGVNNYSMQFSGSYASTNLGYRTKNGDSNTWNPWRYIAFTDSDITGNAATATKLSTTRANYKTSTDSGVVGELMWKNYGNNHTIFDASNSTTPTGVAKNNANPDVAWAATYPTLMGYNGSQTYGVRVDSSRFADQLKTARTINGVSFDGTTNITIADNTKAPLASPALTGTPTAPTAAAGTNNTQIATTAFVLANGANGDSRVWTDVKESRALGTTYTNSSGKSIEVFVTVNNTTPDGNYYISITIGGVLRGRQAASAAYANMGNQYASAQFTVPNGITYSVASSAGSLAYWQELR